MYDLKGQRLRTSQQMDRMFAILFTTQWYFHIIYNHIQLSLKCLARIATITERQNIFFKVSISF